MSANIYGSNQAAPVAMAAPLDPVSEVDYLWDWSDWLSDGGQSIQGTIANHSLDVDDKLQVTNGSGNGELANGNTAIVTRIRPAADAVAGVRYPIACEITDDDGQTQRRTATFLVKSR